MTDEVKPELTEEEKQKIAQEQTMKEQERRDRADACMRRIDQVFAEFDCSPHFEVTISSGGTTSFRLTAVTNK